MELTKIEWAEFVTGIENKSIRPWVDINKGHALLKSEIGPSNWRFMIKTLTFVTIWAIPISIVLFFFVKWWIPVLIIITSFMTMKGVRVTSAQAVVEEALKDETFYTHARLSGTLKIYTD